VSAAEARTWVTEIWSPAPDDGVVRMHSLMREPEPLPDPAPEMERTVSTPTVAELEAATDATAAAIADPAASLADVFAAAEAEEALYAQVFTGPCDREPQPEPEIEI
jgi:hypothetical protein